MNWLHYIRRYETSTPLIHKSNASANHKYNLDNIGEFLKPYFMNDLNNNSDSDDEIKSNYTVDRPIYIQNLINSRYSNKSNSPPKEGINNKEISSNINIKKKE